MDKLLFVYGTLKSGFSNHAVLGDSRYAGEASIKNFEMRDLGAFPGITEMEGGIIHGELYIVSEKVMIDVDQLEGYPNLFNRKEIKTDKGFDAWVYYLDKECRNTVIESGRWLKSISV